MSNPTLTRLQFKMLEDIIENQIRVHFRNESELKKKFTEEELLLLMNELQVIQKVLRDASTKLVLRIQP